MGIYGLKINIVTIILFIGIAAVSFNVPTSSAAACTITVTSNSDSGAGSLRAAITQSNSAPSADVICFNLPGGSTIISPNSQLPAITQPATVDGSTQPGFAGTPIVQLAGGSAGANSVGIWIAAGNSTIRGLSILNFGLNGIIVTNTGSNVIAGNYIGINPQGSTGPNGTDGVGILNSPNNRVGGTVANDRNIISGNKGNGVGVTGSAASSNTIQGNFIGTSPNGLGSRPNNGDGILINNSPDTLIGGDNTTPGSGCSGACNLVSGNLVNGVGLWYQDTTNTVIAGNYIGTDISGSYAISNGDIGLEINETANNVAGGLTDPERNVISGNKGAGVFITGASAYGNDVIGNDIGTNAAGTGSVANLKMGVGIGYSPGIQPAHDNIIGSSAGKTLGICDGGCNLISGNASNGILMSLTSGNQIAANHIGVNWDNSGFIANGADGIGILDSPNNSIGGEANIINGNRDNGIIIAGNGSTGNRIVANVLVGNAGAGIMLAAGVDNAMLENSIAANGKLGIDIGYNNVSRNDTGDSDGGPNQYQNFPDVYAVENTGGASYISGTLNSRPSTAYRIDFYQSDGCNAGKPDNYGEGQQYIGNLILNTDQYGNKVFTFPTPQPLTGNKYITTTATKMVGAIPAETSEFSLCRLVNTTRPALTNGANWYLKDDLTSGVADKSFGYGFPSHLLMCAWDANQKGVKLPVVVNGTTWYMRASYTTGVSDHTFQYGFFNGTPVCGDWDGDGVDTVGMFGGGNWFLRNSNTPGNADVTAGFGASNGRPVVGDWDGNGSSGIGVVTTTDSLVWNLRNSADPGLPDYSFSYGGNSAVPVVGDWDGNGRSDIGAYYSGTWNVRTVLSAGVPTGAFSFGTPGYTPVSW